MGAGALLSYSTAWDLYQKVQETMPWWNPGSLRETQGWGLTPFLLRERGELPQGVVLDAGSARVVRLHLTPEPRANEHGLAFGLLGSMAVAALAAAAWRRSRG